MGRLIVISILFVFVSSCISRSQNEIRRVESEVERLNTNVDSLRASERILIGFSAEGTGVIAYRDSDGIRRINVEALGETGKYLADYYFRERHPIYVSFQRIDYKGDIMESLQGKELAEDVAESGEFFYSGKKLILWFETGEEIATTDPRFVEMGNAVYNEAQSFFIFMETPLADETEVVCDWICDRFDGDYCISYICN